MAEEATTDGTENFEVTTNDTPETLTASDGQSSNEPASLIEVVPENEVNVESVKDDTTEESSSADESTVDDDKTDDGVETNAGDDTTASTKEEKPKGVQKRINKVVREREEAKRQAEAYKREIAELKGEKKTETESTESSKEPKESDFETYGEYLDAVDVYEKSEATTEKPVEAKDKAKGDEIDAPELTDSQKTAIAVLNETIDSAENMPKDFAEVVNSPDVSITPEMLEVIAECEDPAKVLYHLGKNKDIASEIAAGSMTKQMRAITKIDLTVESKPSKPVKTTEAPDTITPVTASDSQEKPLNELSFKEHEERMNKLERQNANSGW